MIAVLLAVAAAATPVSAVRCGAVARPGIAERGDDGVWRGVAVDLCRKVAQAEGIPVAAIDFHPYRTTADLRDARRDTLAVLTRAEAIALPAATLGPPIAISRQLLLVRSGSAPMHHSDLGGRRVCFIVASAAEAALNTWARAGRIAIQRAGFQEPVELRDAFDSGYCAAMAVDGDDIPGSAANTRPLGPPLSQLPLYAVRAN